jgi:hypothetical protein
LEQLVPGRLELERLDSKRRRHLGLVAVDLSDERLGPLTGGEELDYGLANCATTP